MTSTLALPTRRARRARGSADRVRLDIQGLRALAVVLVVVYHLWPWHLTGGYVGVDVFFVISGFLITSHMLREVDVTGTVSLPRFWARRARRLLPAALLVLVAVLVATALVVPRADWSQYAREVAGSTLYAENWLLAADSVDYLAAANAASPVQHYWSLSVEEQFYLLWPVLVLAAVWVGRRVGMRRRAIGAVLAVVTAASFVSSVAWTASSPDQAYFVTPTRAWEFGAGALLALLPAVAGAARVRAAAAWIGLAAIVAAAVTFDDATPFPGAWALLPVIGTGLVLWADGDGVRGAPTGVLRFGPVQRVGELSYSIYLWHWPAIVMVPFVLGRELYAIDKLVLGAAVVVLAYATWRWVENPARRARVLVQGRPRLTFGLTLGGMAVLVGASLWMALAVERQVEQSLAQSEELAASASGGGSESAPAITAGEDDAQAPEVVEVVEVVCIGAATVDPAGGCAPTLADGEVVPLPAAAKLDSPEDCLSPKGTRDFEPCEFGVPVDESRGTVALVGDSHAYHWLPALEDIAERHGWHGIVMARASCPYTPADRTIDANVVETCALFNERVTAEIEAREDISVVVMGGYSDVHFAAPAGYVERDFARDRFRTAIEALPARVSDVYVMRDAPKPLADNVACLERALGAGDADPGRACAVTRDEGLVPDMLALAAEESDRAEAVDLSELYCDDAVCVPLVGNVLVYADQGHLTRTWVRSAVPLLERRLEALTAPS